MSDDSVLVQNEFRHDLVLIHIIGFDWILFIAEIVNLICYNSLTTMASGTLVECRIRGDGAHINCINV